MAKGGRIPEVLLWGGRSQARIIHRMLLDSGEARVRAIFDATLERPAFASDAPLVSDPALLKALWPELTHFVACVGSEHGYARFTIAQFLEGRGLKPLTVSHPLSLVDSGASVGEGAQRMPFSAVHKFATVGRQCILNTSCVVEHECVVGDGVHIMPGAVLAGRVGIGDFATVGAHATVLPDLTIGAGAYVGAGSVVTRDVPPRTAVAGNPARHLREHHPRFDEDPLRRMG